MEIIEKKRRGEKSPIGHPERNNTTIINETVIMEHRIFLSIC